MALGAETNKEVLNKLKLRLNKWGFIDVNEKYETSSTKVYAAGVIVGCKSTVAWSARSGRDAAEMIYEFINN